MNVTVFGGIGTTGLMLIQKLLSAGHCVTVFARTPSKLSVQHNNLSIIHYTIDQTIAEADKVVVQTINLSDENGNATHIRYKLLNDSTLETVRIIDSLKSIKLTQIFKKHVINKDRRK